MSRSSAEWKAWSARFSDLPALVAIRWSLPWSFIGLLAALPLFYAFTHSLAAAELPSFGVMAATLMVLLSYRLARAFTLRIPVVIAAACIVFALSLPQPVTADWVAYAHRVGETGLFLAILISLAVCAACVYGTRYAGARTGDAVGAALLIAIVAMLAWSHLSPADQLQALLRPLGALGDSYAALLTIVFAETALWIVGIHGPAALAAIVTPLYLTLQLQNTAAYAHHQPLPHIVAISLFLFVFPGGAGATLAPTIMLLFARARRLRLLARAVIVPAIFNINEPLLFGLPIVFNGYLLVPFIAAPLVTATTTYFAVASYAVRRTIWYVPSSIPSPISTYLATFDPRALLLVLLNILIAGAIYAPFVAAYDRHEVLTHQP